MSAIEERLKATRLVGKLLATAQGRKFMENSGYRSGQAIVAAHYDELIRDVMKRVHSHKPPVTVALVRNDELFMFGIAPARDITKKRPSLASPASTIGMLYDACIQRDGNDTFQITEWDGPTTAVAMPDVRELFHA